MLIPTRVYLRYLIGGLAMIIFAILMYLEIVNQAVGVPIIVAILAALGLIEGYNRRINNNGS